MLRRYTPSPTIFAGSVPPLDGLANLTGAWSPGRKLLSSYAGPLVQLDGSDDVDLIPDQSGNGFDFALITAGQLPTLTTVNGRTAVLFNGVDDALTTAAGVCGSLFAADSAYFIWTFVVDDAPLNQVALYQNNPIVTDFSDTNIGIFAKNNAELFAYNFDTGIDSITYAFTRGSVYTMEEEHLGGFIRRRINGGAWSTPVASGDTDGSYANDRLGLFCSQGGARTKGKFIAGAIFSVPPSDGEKNTLAATFTAYARGVIYDDFVAPNGTLLKGRICPTGQVWATTGPGHLIAEINSNSYISDDNTYALLPWGEPVPNVSGRFSWTPVPGSLEDRDDTCVTLIADAAENVGDALQTCLHCELYADRWDLKKRISGGSFDSIATGVHTLSTDGTIYSAAMQIGAGSVRLFLPNGTQQVVNDAAIGTTIIPASGVWQVTAGITSFQKRWNYAQLDGA